MKKKFIILSGLLLGMGVYTVTLLAQVLTKQGLYCETQESYGSKVKDAQRRAQLLRQGKTIGTRASQIPSLPRTSRPFQKNVGGQDYTCVYFNTQAQQSGPGWQMSKDNGKVNLKLDESQFYGLDHDQFVVDPKTGAKIPAIKGSGKVIYRFEPIEPIQRPVAQ